MKFQDLEDFREKLLLKLLNLLYFLHLILEKSFLNTKIGLNFKGNLDFQVRKKSQIQLIIYLNLAYFKGEAKEKNHIAMNFIQITNLFPSFLNNFKT